VVALQANFCLVDLEASGPEERVLCTRRTRLGKRGQAIHVGDRVRVEGLASAGGRGAIVAVAPRANLLARPGVANVDRVVVVVALEEPGLDPMQLTRFLIGAEAAGAAVQVVLSKADLLPAEAVRAWCRRVESWGYPVGAVSLPEGSGLDELRRALGRPGLAVLCGPSGVGKSSLLNALCPALDLRVSAVSGRLRRGRHTTRHVELFALAPGALLADTPGFNRPVLPADPVALARSFPELRPHGSGAACRFRNCRHRGDPGCAFGTDWDRYPLYLHCLAEVEAEAARQAAAGGTSAAPDWRRRVSRRTDRQRLEETLSSPDRAD
jgi:ribosome biogenesis GTPase